MTPSPWTTRGATLLLAASLAGCLASPRPLATPTVVSESQTLLGQVSFPVGRQAQAALTEVGNQATVSLIDATSGNTVSSSITDSAGNFVLNFGAFRPTPGVAYLLEAIKGLSIGGAPNRVGAPAVRVRTLVVWNNGWQSLTNATPGPGVSVSEATTALCTLLSLKEQAGTPIGLASLMGKLNGSSFDESGTGLSAANDFAPVLNLVRSALLLDQDPVGGIAFDAAAGRYTRSNPAPVINAVSPPVPASGQTVTLLGSGFDGLPGQSAFWFGNTPAATWTVSVDRTTVTVSIPPAAASGPFLMERTGGNTVEVSPFLRIQGTVSSNFTRSVLTDSPRDGAVDAQGNYYVADSALNQIFKVAPTGATTVLAGSGVAGYQDGPGASARFSEPTGLAIDAAGNVYVADTSNHRIRKVTPDGVVSTVAGSGTGGFLDGAAGTAQFKYPYGVALDNTGNLLVADTYNNRIRLVQSGGTVSTLAGTGSSGMVDAASGSAQFYRPYDLAVGSDGSVYVADTNNHRIRRLSPAGVVSTFAGTSAGFQDGASASARFNHPTSLALDAAGNLLVSDTDNYRVRRITPGGTVSTVAGSSVQGSQDGPIATAQFSYPMGVTVDANGHLYVADYGSGTVRVVVP